MVLDNQIYGLTTGQTSPTSRIGMKTKSSPYGNMDTPVNPLTLALSAGATFVGRGFSGEQKHLTELIKQAIQHKGFSFLDIFSPCVTYNKDNTFQWFRPRVKKLEEDAAYDSTNWIGAMERATQWGEIIPIGKFYERTDLPTLEETEPVLDDMALIHRELHIPEDVAMKFIEELM
jgi:2-oxoglutarate ferredoxin oxidoreductase subunit beta